ncbi:MAG: hypothetical protein H8E61_01520 [Bacteroidetes bacterium]|nr:hypothetical protein [Bacteroidota bacterium]
MKIKYLFLIILLTNCCVQVDEETKMIDNYLKNTFNESIKYDHYYLVFSKFFCHNCVSSALSVLELTMDTNCPQKYTVISYTDENLPVWIKENFTTLIDNNANIDYLNLELSNFSIIKTNEYGIDFIKIFDTGESIEITNYLK